MEIIFPNGLAWGEGEQIEQLLSSHERNQQAGEQFFPFN